MLVRDTPGEAESCIQRETATSISLSILKILGKLQ